MEPFTQKSPFEKPPSWCVKDVLHLNKHKCCQEAEAAAASGVSNLHPCVNLEKWITYVNVLNLDSVVLIIRYMHATMIRQITGNDAGFSPVLLLRFLKCWLIRVDWASPRTNVQSSEIEFHLISEMNRRIRCIRPLWFLGQPCKEC